MNSHLHLLKDTLGWVAMAAFAASYLCRSAGALRRAQAGAATLWIVYGIAAGTPPVIVSNAVVAFMAVVYPWIKGRQPGTTSRPGLVGAVLGGWCPPSAFAKPGPEEVRRG